MNWFCKFCKIIGYIIGECVWKCKNKWKAHKKIHIILAWHICPQDIFVGVYGYAVRLGVGLWQAIKLSPCIAYGECIKNIRQNKKLPSNRMTITRTPKTRWPYSQIYPYFWTGKFGCFCLKFIGKHSRAPPIFSVLKTKTIRRK